MNCFYHSETPAIGICKNCYRGLCVSCIAEVDNGIACKSRCEDAALIISDLMERNRKMYQKSASVYVGIGWLMVIIGCSAIVISILQALSGQTTSALVNLVFATFFIGFAYVMFKGAKQLKSR
jgi:hypothetical protein